jgi:streptogramin lyase
MATASRKAPNMKVFKRTVLFASVKLWALMHTQAQAQPDDQPYTFTTLAGGHGYGTNVAGNAARISTPAGVAVDAAGNIYVADTFNHVIRKVTPSGGMTTLAGFPGTFGSTDGTGSDARFFNPDKLALDGAGNVYVSDNGNNTIRKITPEGVVTTLAGKAGISGSADGTNSAARFYFPEGVSVDSAGNVFVADSGNSTIRKLAPVGTHWVVTTVAGRAGLVGGVDGTNSGARFNWLQGLAIDRAGNLYVGDTDNYAVRKVVPVGTNWVVTTLAGMPGSPGSVDGANSAARFGALKGIAVDKAGNVYAADNDYSTIRMLTSSGTNWIVTTPVGLAQNPGSADGTNNAARLAFPYDVAVDDAGNLYVADSGNDAVRKVTPAATSWVVTTLSGLGGMPGSADGAGSSALFRGPAAVAVGSTGDVYVADQINHTIRRVTTAGEVTTVAGLAGFGGDSNGTNGDARFCRPSGVAVDGAGTVYVVEQGNSTLRKATPAGTNWLITTLATGFSEPRGLSVDGAGNVYVADSLIHTIDKVTPAGAVTGWAGMAGSYGSVDGIGTAARFNYPVGVAVDNATNIYVADTGNHTIRKLNRARVVTTLAGLAGNPGSADGTGNVARFNYPSGIAVDPAGNLYVADTYNNTIRKLTPIGTDWVVTTLGGMPGFYGTLDGNGNAARFGNPNGVAVDSAGNLYVADFYFNTIRTGYPPPRLSNAGFSAGQFRFDLTGPPGQSVIVESSPDLVNWLPIWTNTSAGSFAFSDTQTGVSSNRFYRARLP